MIVYHPFFSMFLCFSESCPSRRTPFFWPEAKSEVSSPKSIYTFRYFVNFAKLRLPFSAASGGDAVSNGVPFAAIQKAGGKVVVANATSIDFAVLQLGMSFGNNGNNPSRLTVNWIISLFFLVFCCFFYRYAYFRVLNFLGDPWWFGFFLQKFDWVAFKCLQ